ncbi:MAG: CRISPR-associated protein Cas4 [Caldilineaceae bacterium SB0675_bin_29]|uniref:CRISPR-associated exonuclease Cas4 n=1 Tax=Caldilineaceae bacterium SB0675_bin_29 TaxID=2605266 RepID=A0A6B1FVG7_9CHLR|nr:CRISPR-associated protein Cas4 [Caldilineaceae bacterium SB0675_bin_29]
MSNATPFPNPPDPVPLSLLNDFLYCQRRAALKAIEGWRGTNEHTVVGDSVHEQADVSGYETVKGVNLLRALPVWSDRLGLNGKCDIVERHPDGSLVPVEFKKGKRRKFDNDDAQLCAQALCLEEMFGLDIPKGAIFHARSKRRREVEFTEDLRRLTEQAIKAMHRLIEAEAVPQAVHKPQCSECSLFDHCLPEITSVPPTLARAYRAVFDTTD